MKTEPSDITQQVISRDFILANLGCFFSESIFLNLNHEIIEVSDTLVERLEYLKEELIGRSLSCLTGTNSFELKIRELLKGGLFSKVMLSLKKKDGQSFHYYVSGFYLGLISDFNNIIVLKFSAEREVDILNRQLQLHSVQIDNFIYRSAHDIRGPVATIKGLINLIKIREDYSELDYLIHLIDAHTQKLDEQLASLSYLTQVDENENVPTFRLDFYDLETHIRKVVERNSFLDFLEISFDIEQESAYGVNEYLLKTLLENLFLYLFTLQKFQAKTQINVKFKLQPNFLVTSIQAIGFLIDESTRSAIENGETSMYISMLRYSKLTHFFAAKKVARKLKSTLKFSDASNECNIIVNTPLNHV